ncbi:MAG: efflux RND transporter permease subunit [Deltaproteobacteria bacterium]|nr:efflux RND transporter permease subunit [Deltaproteobacteria bacterium]
MKLPEFAVKRPNTVLMIFLGLFLFGTISLSKLGIDMLPEIEPPAISIIVPYPGASASDVESDVTKYLEDQLSTVNNLDKLRSLSKDNLSVVTCQFDWGTNLDVASNDVRDKIDLAKADIEEHAPDAKEPILFKFSSASAPIMVVSVIATESWKNLYRIVDKQIVDPLKRIKGVGAIMIYGGLRRQINVEFDRERLAAFYLSPDVIIRTLAGENLDMPAGNIKMGRTNYILRLRGRFESSKEVGGIIVGQNRGRPIYLRDVAHVEDGFEEQKMKGWANGKDAVILIIQKQSGANTVAVCNAIRQRMADLKKDLPHDLEITSPMDSSEFIINSINNLKETLLVAGILVVLVTIIFLRRFRASLIIILTIPFSLIIAFIFLFSMKYTINIVSLMSLSIAIGMVVDDAIVVLENITRHVEEGHEGPSEASIFGSSEVGLAVVASTLTTVVVFAPLIFVSGLAGIVFKQLGAIVAITMLGSLFSSLTLTPMLTSKWLKPVEEQKIGPLYRKSEQIFKAIESFYGRLLAGALMHRKKILLGLLVVFAGSFLLLRFMGTDLFPDVDTGELDIRASLNESARLEESEKVAMKLQELYKDLVPEKRDYYAFIGETEMGIGAVLGMEEGPNIAESGAKLIDKEFRKRSAKEIAAALRKEAKKIPGIERMTVTATSMTSQVLMGGGKKVEIEITGHDLAVTNDLARKVKEIFERTQGAVDIRVTRKRPRAEVWVKVDRVKAAELGVSTAAVASALRTNYYGFEATKFREAGDDFDVFVRLHEEDRSTLKGIGEIMVPSMRGDVKLVKLKNIARIEDAMGPVEIERKNRERIVKVGADTYGRSLGEVKTDVEKELAKLDIPPGVSISFGGEVEEQRKTFRDLATLLIVGIILVYMVLVSQFESLKTPFVIAFSLPFAFTGVIWAFYVTGITLNIMSFMGVILLMGVVVKNAIVLIDYTNILRARGLPLFEAIKQAGSHRLRPVLMTTFTTIFGMVPLALSRAQGSEMWQPFGITVIAGLTLSTLVTLILVPIIYSIFEERAELRKGEVAK